MVLKEIGICNVASPLETQYQDSPEPRSIFHTALRSVKGLYFMYGWGWGNLRRMKRDSHLER